MKITLTQIKKLIQEQLLQEQVFGNLAYVYHGSNAPPDVMLDLIKNKKFDPGKGAGAMYGPGLYTIREFKPDANTFSGGYGGYVYKFKANLAGIVSFDSDVTQQIYGKSMSITEQIQFIIDNNLVGPGSIQKLKQFLANNKNESLKEKEYHIKHSSAAALNNWQSLISVVRGISFTGANDGPVVIFYSLDGVVPVAWSKTGGKTQKDFVWNQFGVDSQKQNYDYEPFNKIKKDYDLSKDNLHKLANSFYKPNGQKFVIDILEKLKNDNEEKYELLKNIIINDFDINYLEIIKNIKVFDGYLKIFEIEENYKSVINFIENKLYRTIPKKESDIFLEKLIESKIWWIKEAVAKNYNCPPEILLKLINDDKRDVALKAFKNPNFPPNIKYDLELLRNHKHPSLIGEVAIGRDTPPEILLKLIYDDDLAETAYRNENFPRNIKFNWEFLSIDKNNNFIEIQEHAAENPECPPEILEKLFNLSLSKKTRFIKFLILHNSNCPPAVKLKIAKETNPENFSIDETSLKKLKLNLFKIDNDEKTLDKIIKILSRDPDPDIKSAAQEEAQKRNLKLESLYRKISKLIYAIR
jgi:hypothetical protein